MPDLLFPGDICANNHGGNDRSMEAHESVVGDKKRQAELIIAHLKKTGGSICEEVEHALGLKHQTASARMSELKRAGVCVPIGTRLTTSGCKADVLAIRETGDDV